MAIPTLIIGLGGLGHQVVSEVKGQILDSHGGQLPSEIRFLVFDTIQEGQESQTISRRIEPSEYCFIGGDLSGYVREIASGRYPEISSWFASENYLRSLHRAAFELAHGSGQSRQFARLALFRDLGRFSESVAYRYLRAAIGSCLRAGKTLRLQAFLISSLAGGTGSGILLDIAHLVRIIATEEFRNPEILIQGYIVLTEAFGGIFSNMDTMTRARVRAFAAMRELFRFQNPLDFETGYPMKYHQKGQGPIWHNSVKRKLFDQIYFLDGTRSTYPLTNIPLSNGIVPLIASSIFFAIDEDASQKLTYLRINTAAHYANTSGSVEHATVPLGGALSAFSIELPLHRLIEEWSLKLALEVLDNLLAPKTRASETIPTEFSSDANSEVVLGTPGRNEVRSFLRAGQLSGPLGITNMTLLMAEVERISEIGLDQRGLIQEFVHRDFLHWIRLLDPGAIDEETVSFQQRLRSMLESARLSYRIPTSKQLKEAPRLGVRRIKDEVIQRKLQFLGSESSNGISRGGVAHDIFVSLQKVQTSQFRHALLIQIDRIINGVSDDPRKAKTGKLGYAMDFLDGLNKALDITLTILDQTHRLKESEYQVYTSIVGAAEMAFYNMEKLADKKLFGFLVHPSTFQSQEKYLRAEQALIEMELGRIALFALTQTIREMRRCVEQSQQNLTSWVEVLTTGSPVAGKRGIYSTLLEKMHQLRLEKERERAKVSQLFVNDDAYEVERYNFYAHNTIDWISKILGDFRWIIGLQTTDDNEGVEMSLQIETQSLFLEQIQHNADILLRECWKAFSEAKASETLISVLCRKYSPEQIAKLIAESSAPALAMHPPLNTPIIAHYVGIQIGQDSQQRFYVDSIIDRLSETLGFPRDRLNLVELDDPTKCIYVTYVEPVDLSRCDAFSRGKEKYFDLQSSGKIDGQLVHVFPGEVNAVSYEQRLPREAHRPYRTFHPNVVALLEYPDYVKLFIRACIYRLIEIAHDNDGHSFIRLRLPNQESAESHDHPTEIMLTSVRAEGVDWFEALLTFTYSGTDRRAGTYMPIDYARVQEACARVQQQISEVDEIATMAEKFLSRVVDPLEQDIKNVVDQDLGILLRLIVQDEVANLRKVGQLGLGFFSLWDNLDVADFHHRVRSFCKRLSRVSALPLAKVEATDEDLYLFAIDAREAFADVILPFSVLPVLFLQKQRMAHGDLARIRRLLESSVGTTCKVALLVVFANHDNLQEARRLLRGTMKEAFAYDIICPSREDLRTIITASQGQAALRRLVLSQINLTSVSPFVTWGPTRDTMFFGREKELREITEHADTASYVLLGGRRIGKTSILKRLERVRLPAAGFRALYHDCSFTPTQAELVQAVVTDKSWFPETPSSTSRSLDRVIKALLKDKPLVILFDEADKLIEPDRRAGYSLFNTLRAITNSGRCRFVLSGEQALRTELVNPNSPLYNFGNEKLIGRLDFRAVEELVTRPLKQLEIELEDDAEIVQRIWNLTSGHPNVVQRLCQRLIVRLNERGDRRLTLDDVETVVSDPDFLRKDFLNIFWERATALERLCSLSMAANENSCTLSALQEALITRGIQVELSQVDDALERLVDLRNILQRTSTGYEFAVTAFPEIIAKTARLDDLIALNRETFQHHGDVEPHSEGGGQ